MVPFFHHRFQQHPIHNSMHSITSPIISAVIILTNSRWQASAFQHFMCLPISKCIYPPLIQHHQQSSQVQWQTSFSQHRSSSPWFIAHSTHIQAPNPKPHVSHICHIWAAAAVHHISNIMAWAHTHRHFNTRGQTRFSTNTTRALAFGTTTNSGFSTLYWVHKLRYKTWGTNTPGTGPSLSFKNLIKPRILNSLNRRKQNPFILWTTWGNITTMNGTLPYSFTGLKPFPQQQDTSTDRGF